MTREEAIQYLQPIADSAHMKRYSEALGVAISALREQEPVTNRNGLTGWISVEDRLPEDDPNIKKHVEGEKFGFLTVLVYNGVVKQTNRFFCNVPQLGFPQTDGWEWAPMNVTHWMPLPAAPEEKENPHETKTND